MRHRRRNKASVNCDSVVCVSSSILLMCGLPTQCIDPHLDHCSAIHLHMQTIMCWVSTYNYFLLLSTRGPSIFLILICETQFFQNISVDNGPISSPRGHQQSRLEQVPRSWAGDQVEPKMALSFRFSFSTDQTFFLLVIWLLRVQALYIWIDGSGEGLRSKTKTLESVNFPPGRWIYHYITPNKHQPMMHRESEKLTWTRRCQSRSQTCRFGTMTGARAIRSILFGVHPSFGQFFVSFCCLHHLCLSSGWGQQLWHVPAPCQDVQGSFQGRPQHHGGTRTKQKQNLVVIDLKQNKT